MAMIIIANKIVRLSSDIIAPSHESLRRAMALGAAPA
jgi:hypothetical protein